MTPASSESRLTSELQSLLARPIWSQRFSRRLELRFRRDSAERSTRLTRGTFTLALLILAVYLLIDGLTVQRLTDPVFAILVAGIGGSLTLIGAAGSYVPHWHHSLMRLLPFIMLVVNLAMVAAAGRCLALGLPPPTELLVLQLINIQLLSGMSFRTTFPVALTTTAALIFIEIVNGSGSTSSIQDISFVIFALLTCSLGSFLSEQVMRRSWLQGRLLDHLANHDELTGLYNRHALIQRAEALMQKAAHERCAVSVILCDIDFFKRLNDRRGHLAGDEALRDVSEALHQAAARRGTDVAARWGGEEFLLVLYDCDSDAAVARAEAARQHIERLHIPNPDAANGYLTMSFGCATQEAGANLALNALVGAADTALYRAKSEGRNRTCVQIPQDGVAQQTPQPPSPDAIKSAMH